MRKSLNSQDCNDYFTFKKGTEFEYAHYNAKNKLDSKNRTFITDVQQSNGVWIVKTEVVAVDEKEKEFYKESVFL